MIETETLVIGAGLSGLTLARKLSENSSDVVLIEKSGSAGGRLSTRRSEAGNFDHGAQYLTNRAPGFAALLAQLADSGDVARWNPSGKDSTHPWWVGQPGMSAIGKAMACELDISYQTRATQILKQGRKFLVHTQQADADGPVYRASRVVAAVPAPQALALLAPIDPEFETLLNVGMAPCWSAMLAFEHPLAGVSDLSRGQDGDVLGLIARNSSKPGRTGETFVMHATLQWSRAHVETDRETVRSSMLEAMRRQTGLADNLPCPVLSEVHRWLYAFVDKPLNQDFLANSQKNLFACGDWSIGARAQAAHHSGQALADHIMSL